ncbi:cell division protein FtsL [Rhodobacteraceae bacterium NNCM2]|nr:cell division protein FtsL [Coraliihabitans acroporae]
MKRIGLCIGLVAVILAATWTYNVNYRTRQAFDRIADLRAEIAAEGETVQVLRVEWAWLNAPRRLKELVRLYNDDLGLIRLEPDRYGFVSSVPFPPPERFDLEDAIKAAGEIVAPGVEAPKPAFDIPLPVARPRGPLDARQVAWGRE